MIIYEGKHLKLVRTPGLRFGVGYLPHYKSNNEINPGKARQLIVWCGPWFSTWSLPAPRNYRPIRPDDPKRLERLIQSRRDINDEIAIAYRYRYRRENRERIARERGSKDSGD